MAGAPRPAGRLLTWVRPGDLNSADGLHPGTLRAVLRLPAHSRDSPALLRACRRTPVTPGSSSGSPRTSGPSGAPPSDGPPQPAGVAHRARGDSFLVDRYAVWLSPGSSTTTVPAPADSTSALKAPASVSIGGKVLKCIGITVSAPMNWAATTASWRSIV
jgi:hypothetical protein